MINVCSSSKIVLLLDALQLLIFSAGMLTYFEPKLFLLIMFQNGTFLIIKILIVLNTYLFIHSFFSRQMVSVIKLNEILLLSNCYNLPCFVYYLCVCLFSSLMFLVLTL
jgi:hypothetical protein